MSKYKGKEKLMEIIFLIAACISIISVVLICIFLFMNGIPAMKKIGFGDFIFGQRWRPGNNIFGIWPMILGSIYVTAGAIIIGVPIGVLSAIYLAKFCPKGIYKIIKPGVELLAGIPSVVYGFFGLVVLVPFIRNTFEGNGNSILTASILLGIMILPTIIGVSESAIRAVPNKYYEGALHWVQHMKEVYIVPLYRQQNRESWQELSLELEERSERPWLLSWLQETRQECQKAYLKGSEP